MNDLYMKRVKKFFETVGDRIEIIIRSNYHENQPHETVSDFFYLRKCDCMRRTQIKMTCAKRCCGLFRFK